MFATALIENRSATIYGDGGNDLIRAGIDDRSEILRLDVRRRLRGKIGVQIRTRIGPAQQRLQPCFGVDGEAERPEMQRQKYRQRQSGKPMHQRREPEQVATMVEPRTLHGSTTAATARKPIASSSRPTPIATASTLRPLSGDHSINIVRMPIGA